MKFILKFTWAFIWLFIGVILAYDSGTLNDDPLKATFMVIATLVCADAVHKIIKKSWQKRKK